MEVLIKDIRNPFELSLSEKQIPRFIGTSVVMENGRSCWSREACAQGRRASYWCHVQRVSEP